MKEYTSNSTEETKKIAAEVAKSLIPGDVLALYGDLGSGKTTFTSYLVHSLGLENRVQSPTFVIARKYSGSSGLVKTVNHLDLYRLTTIEEVEDLGLKEMFDEEAITIIEWPEVAETLLPDEVKVIEFYYMDENVRKIKFMSKKQNV